MQTRPPAGRASRSGAPSIVAMRIAKDMAATNHHRSPKKIAVTLSRYLEAANVTPTELQFNHLVAVIASGSLR